MVAHIIGGGVGKLKLRMKRGDLDNAVQIIVVHGGVGQVEHVVEQQKIGKQGGLNQQCGFDFVGIAGGQKLQFLIQGFQKAVQMAGMANSKTHLVFGVGRFGKRAQIKPNHGLLQPNTGGVDADLVGWHGLVGHGEGAFTRA